VKVHLPAECECPNTKVSTVNLKAGRGNACTVFLDRLLQPEWMMGFDPGGWYAPEDNPMQTALDKEDAHVDVNDESANGRQGAHAVQKHYERQHPVSRTWHQFREPHDDSGDQQRDSTVKHNPVELLLTGIEVTRRRHLLVIVDNVVFDGFAPLKVFLGGLHITAP